MAIEWDQILPPIATAALGAAGAWYTAKRKARTDDRALLSSDETHFRQAVMKRLNDCENRHDECERNLAVTRKDMSDTWQEIVRLREELQLAKEGWGA